MTSYYPFQPTRKGAPTYQVTLDGVTYQLVVKWNLFGQRYYISCFDNTGIMIFNVSLITSPEALALASMSWDAATLKATLVTSLPHNYKIGTVVGITVASCNPSGYNGQFLAAVQDAFTVTFPMSIDPGTSVANGTISNIINLCKGYFETSTLIYRNSQLEVSP